MNNSLALLGLLGVQAKHGYDLKRDYDRLFGREKPMPSGQIYAALARMIRDGLILALGTSQEGGPERKSYEITAAGRARLHRWFFTPDTPSPTLQSELFAKTVVALLLDDDAERLLDVQRAEHMNRMRALTRAKADADLLGVLMLDHGLFHIEADLRWIDITSARLGALRAEMADA